jgi:Flp pilus assembly pilin Flp
MNRRLPGGPARGQASVEYIVVLALVTLVLIVVAVDPAAINELFAAAKSFFKAFSYVLSIPAQDAL